MMSFHSARHSKRFWIYKTHSEELRGFTVVCLNCEFLTDVSGLDKMATHLNEKPSHSCQVIIENVPLNCLDAENVSDLMNNELPNNESEENCQKILRHTTPEGKEETSASASQQLNDSTEETKKDHAENQANEGPLGDDCKKSASLVLEDSSVPEVQDCSKHSIDAAEEEVTDCLGNQTDKDLLAAEVKENKSSVSENSSVPEVQACSKDPTDFAEEGNTDSIVNQTEEATLSEYKEEAILSEYKDDESASTVEDSSISDLQSCSKDLVEENASNLKNQDGEGSLAAQCEENKSFLVVGNSSCVGLQDCSKDHIESAGGNAGSLEDQGEVSLAAGCKENRSIPESSPRLAVCSSEPIDSAEEANGVNLESEVSLVVENKGSSLNVESATTSELQICSKVSSEAAAEEHLGDQVDECEESTPATSLGDSNIEPQVSTERTKCGDSDDDNVEEENSKKPKAKIGHQSSDDEVSNDAIEVPDADERLAGMNIKSSNFTSEDGVSFEQFLRRRGETESASSDASEQGSIHLEPLTPSEVLEHETTEILQKGGVAPSAKKAGLGSEQSDVAAVSTENSPIQAEASVSQTEEIDETS